MIKQLSQRFTLRTYNSKQEKLIDMSGDTKDYDVIILGMCHNPHPPFLLAIGFPEHIVEFYFLFPIKSHQTSNPYSSHLK